MRQPSVSYAAAEQSLRHVFVRDLKLVSPVRNRRLRINLDLAVLEETASIHDQLANVVCYEAMTTNIRRLVVIEKITPDEVLAERIAAMSFHDARVKRVRVQVETLEAASGAGVSVERERAPGEAR